MTTKPRKKTATTSAKTAGKAATRTKTTRAAKETTPTKAAPGAASAKRAKVTAVRPAPPVDGWTAKDDPTRRRHPRLEHASGQRR
jgi:hypothetical protein